MNMRLKEVIMVRLKKGWLSVRPSVCTCMVLCARVHVGVIMVGLVYLRGCLHSSSVALAISVLGYYLYALINIRYADVCTFTYVRAH